MTEDTDLLKAKFRKHGLLMPSKGNPPIRTFETSKASYSWRVNWATSGGWGFLTASGSVHTNYVALTKVSYLDGEGLFHLWTLIVGKMFVQVVRAKK